MDEETRSFKIVSTKGSIGTAQIRTIGWFANQYSTDESTKSNVPGINNKTYTIMPDSLFVGSSNPKPSIFTVCSRPPVILREAEGKVAESTDMNEPTPSRRGWTVNKDRWWPGKNTFTDPSSALPGFLFPKEKIFLWFLKSRFCNSGQALRAEWPESEMEEWSKSEKAEWMN